MAIPEKMKEVAANARKGAAEQGHRLAKTAKDAETRAAGTRRTRP